MLGSNLSAVAGDLSMRAVFRHCPLQPLFTHAFVPNALNPGGMGAEPSLQSDRIPYLFLAYTS